MGLLDDQARGRGAVGCEVLGAALRRDVGAFLLVTSVLACALPRHLVGKQARGECVRIDNHRVLRPHVVVLRQVGASV